MLHIIVSMSNTIAAILGVNAKKVNHWLTKGKQQMKEELAKEGITHADE